MPILWWLTLALLAIFTSNPITLNARQFQVSERAALVRVVDWSQGRVEMLRGWSVPDGEELPVSEFRIRQFGAARPEQQADQYLLPLRPVEPGLYELTPLPDPRLRAQAYPATADVLTQWERLRRELHDTAFAPQR